MLISSPARRVCSSSLAATCGVDVADHAEVVVDVQAAARAADRATIALHGPARAVTNFELDCYGPEARQRSGDDLKAYLLALRPPPRAGDPGRAAAAAPSSAAARRCGRCAACRQPRAWETPAPRR